MIFSRAYFGKFPIVRIYRNGQVIWAMAAYSGGMILLILDSHAAPTARLPDPYRMTPVMHFGTVPRPAVWALVPIRASCIVRSCGVPLGCTIQVRHAQGVAESLLKSLGAPKTYGMVFGRGSVHMQVGHHGMGHSVDCTYGTGRTDGISGYRCTPQCGTAEHVFTVIPMGSYGGSCRVILQPPVRGAGHGHGSDSSLARPTTRWAAWQEPEVRGSQLYIRMIRHIEQQGNALLLC